MIFLWHKNTTKGDYPMNAPGKGLLKTVSILFIIFGAIATILSLFGVLGSAVLASVAGEFGAGAVGGLLMIVTILVLVVSVLELVLGIVGLKKCGDPAQAQYFIVTGIILCVLALASLIMSILESSFNFMSLIGFVLPVLYIVGGSMNKKVAAK